MRDKQFFHITGTTDDGAVSAIPCVLHSIVVNTPGDAGTITVTDGASTIAVITMGTAAFELDYHVRCTTGLSVVVSEACDITVVWS